MRYTKWFASIALAAGMVVAGTTAASAQDWRDTRHEYTRADCVAPAIARDRARVSQDYRHVDRRDIAHDRAQRERDQTQLRAQSRDTRYDRGYDSDRGNSNGYTDSHNHR